MNWMPTNDGPETNAQNQEAVADRYPARLNPRLVFTDPDSFFGRDFYYDLLLEQQEGQG